MTEQQATDALASLALPRGYTGSVRAIPDELTFAVHVTGPEGWSCEFAGAANVPIAQSSIDAHAGS